MKKYFCLLSSLVFILCISAGKPEEAIKINTQESKINWKGKKPAGEHHGYVKLSEGFLRIDDNIVKGGSFVIDMQTIKDTDLTDSKSNEKLVNHLKSKDFFDVEKFPTARFDITRVSKLKNNPGDVNKATHRIEGNLTIKGITKKVSFDASINLLNGRFTASTPEFTINRTEWDVNYQSKSVVAGLKDQFIYDEIALSIELVSD